MIPPLLNDFIGLQKDTVLVSFIGVVEIFRQTQIRQQATFNFTPFMVTALVFLAVTIPLARLTDWLIARERDWYAASVAAGSRAARRGRLRVRPMIAVGEALRVEGLRKSFGELEVLRGIDLGLAEHEVVCVIGASGKSTLLRCINLLEPIDAGRIVSPARRSRRRTSTSIASDATSGSSSRTSTSSRT